MQVIAGLIETFGPFLIPATLFVVGVAGYAILWAVTGTSDKWAANSERNAGEGSADQDTTDR